MAFSKSLRLSLVAFLLVTPVSLSQTASAAQVIAQDLIVQGSICAGFDCVSGESFGFDTLRLKENNLRVNFDDTSASASFPANDWRIVINDTTNGGANYFAIEDSTAGRIPFRVEAGAPVNSLYVTAAGRIGIGTAAPAVQLHVAHGNTPTLRLEQNGSSGFTAQTWDIAGNESNFFIRDATTGRLPFRIKPGAPASSIFVDQDGQIALGNESPQAALHVEALGGKADLLLDGGAVGSWDFSVRNSDGELGINDSATSGGDFIFKTADSAANVPWEFVHRADDGFGLNSGTTAGAEFILSNTGNLIVSGSITSTGPTCASGCDAVFDEDYALPTIEEQAKAMYANRHLPNVGPTSRDQPINLTDHLGNVLNELEKAHIFIAQLNERNKALEARLEKIEHSME